MKQNFTVRQGALDGVELPGIAAFGKQPRNSA
jgi:hypothetical protein